MQSPVGTSNTSAGSENSIIEMQNSFVNQFFETDLIANTIWPLSIEPCQLGYPEIRHGVVVSNQRGDGTIVTSATVWV
jgi:hypothetical protein